MVYYKCNKCGRVCRGRNTLYLNDGKHGSLGLLCIDCCSTYIDDLFSQYYENEVYPYITVENEDGIVYKFVIKIIRYGLKTRLEATEVLTNDTNGYSFVIEQDAKYSDKTGAEKLIKKILNGLPGRSKKEENKVQGEALSPDEVIEGKIAWDERNEEGTGIPKFITNNKEYTLKQLGDMLMEYEGWNFRLEIIDPSGN